MWKKPWGYKEGFACGAGLLVTGLLLQGTAGGIRWELFAWPVNMLVLVLYLLLLAAMHVLRKRVYGFEWLSHYTSAVSSLICVVIVTVVMGLVRQVPSTQSSVDVPGLSKMLSFWPFVLLYIWLASSLGLTILRTAFPLKVRKIPFLLNHAGLFVALLAATFGNADMQRLKMTAWLGQAEWRATDESGKSVELPLAIELNYFTIHEYPSKLTSEGRVGGGIPQRFVSAVTVYTQEGSAWQDTIEVNHPLKVGGWLIYQLGYDRMKGRWSDISIFELVRDPWLPYVYAGIIMLMLGAACLFIHGSFGIFSTCLILVLVGVCFYFFRPAIQNETPMPALQSPWFTPHIVAYMFAYAMLGAAMLMAVYLLWFKKKDIESREMVLCDKLVYVGFAFMTLGMLSGAIWAKAAWGHYWAWDPKETWAAATWFSYLAYIHFRLGRPSAHRRALVLLLVSFLLIQMCWYGINYLPSAQGMSVHTY